MFVPIMNDTKNELMILKCSFPGYWCGASMNGWRNGGYKIKIVDKTVHLDDALSVHSQTDPRK